jgi:tripartite-type tricarboxylate transporter receptor subunit TctC
LLATQAVFAVLPTLNGRKDFNLDTGFTPISLLIKMPSLLMVPATLKVETVPQLVAMLKAGKPGQYSFSSNGVGTSQQLIAEDFFNRVGVKATHVPYASSTQALTALASGSQIDISVDNVPASLSLVRSGRIKALAISTTTRSPMLPDVPTLAESGVPEFNASTWMGLVAPPGISDATRDFLSEEVAKALQEPSVRKALEAQSFLLQSTTPDEFRKLVKIETENLRELLVRNNIPTK